MSIATWTPRWAVLKKEQQANKAFTKCFVMFKFVTVRPNTLAQHLWRELEVNIPKGLRLNCPIHTMLQARVTCYFFIMLLSLYLHATCVHLNYLVRGVSALPERWKLSNLTVRFVEINGLVHEACKFGILLFWSGFCRSLSPRVRVRKIENDWTYMRHANLEFHHSDDLPEFKK